MEIYLRLQIIKKMAVKQKYVCKYCKKTTWSYCNWLINARCCENAKCGFEMQRMENEGIMKYDND